LNVQVRERPHLDQQHSRPVGNLHAQNIKSIDENAISSPNLQNHRSIERDEQDDVLNGLAQKY